MKIMLQEDMLMAFKNVEGVNRPQLEPNYKKTIQDIHKHMFLNEIIYINLYIPKVNKINNQLEQFPPRDDGNPQVKLADNKLMDILESAMPKLW
eukprot:2702360-Ditylum_brightwellii.AAC.1